MKKLLFLIMFLFGFVALNAQTMEKSMKVEDLGTWDKELSPVSKISISSYVTKRQILGNNVANQKSVSYAPKYRYELVVVSNSIYRGNLTKTWIYGARVFIDSLEVTRNQSPDGFTAIINTTPTVLYRYESSLDTINIKITWKSSNYFQGK